MGITPFQERVYALLSQIPPGRVTTYAALARVLHTSPRAVGNALRNNPFAPEIPCHRCVASTGYVNGYNGEVIQKATFKRSKTGAVNGKGHQSRAKGVKKAMQEEQRTATEKGKPETTTKTIPPSGINIAMKLQILKDEGVHFDDQGMLIGRNRVLWDGPWEVPT